MRGLSTKENQSNGVFSQGGKQRGAVLTAVMKILFILGDFYNYSLSSAVPQELGVTAEQ